MKSFNILILLLMFQLSGCGTVNEQSSAVSRNNQLFTEIWRNITETEAEFSLKNDEKEVAINRRARVGGTGELYLEALQREDGVVFYAKFQEELQDNPSNLGAFLKKWFSELKEFKTAGMTWGEDFFQEASVDNENAEFVYAAMQGSKRNCLVFAKRPLRSTEDKHDFQLALGSLCGEVGEDVEKVIEKKLTTAKSVHFDNGRYARNKLFAPAEKRLEEIFRNDFAIEKVGPEINIQKVLIADKKLWIEGSVKDESRIDVVRIAGLLIDPADVDGVFRLQINGVPDDNDFRIVATDEFGNSSMRKLLPLQTVSSLPKEKVETYDLDEEVGKGRKIALIIPNQNYKYEDANGKLKSPINDANKVSETLAKVYGFDVEPLLNHPTLSELRQRLKSLSKKLKPNDTLLIYYAGHGHLYPPDVERGRQLSYWLPSDFTFENPDNWFSDRELRSWTARFPAQQVLVVSDSCYSGQMVVGDVSYQPGGEHEFSRAVMSSGFNKVPDSRRENGLDENELEENELLSDFALAFSESLKDLEKDDIVIAVNLYNQVRRKMHGKSLQIPQYGVLNKVLHEESADFVFSIKEE